jgi:oxygen-independent coproporphyrinogen III oxidase
MAGIYFHVPFCKQKCSYCDFYKSTKTGFIADYVKAVRLELWLQRDYLGSETIETIYFGGGTPSLLLPEQINELLNACKGIFKTKHEIEITLEANPDDLSTGYLAAIKHAGVNRLSIGIQSFSDTDLKFMGRRHDAAQAELAVKNAHETGFNNISVDLIYGVPKMPFEQWQANLKMVFGLNIQHLSAYHLTYHKGTKLWGELKSKSVSEVDEEESLRQFNELVEQALKNGFEQYEISNFAVNGLYSRHNSSYWKQKNYLGLGPSAHSYDQQSRQWNISNISAYLDALKEHKIPATKEELSMKDRFNEYLITSLRTTWGLDTETVKANYGEQATNSLLKSCQKYIETGQLAFVGTTLKLTATGMFVSDNIMAELIQ